MKIVSIKSISRNYASFYTDATVEAKVTDKDGNEVTKNLPVQAKLFRSDLTAIKLNAELFGLDTNEFVARDGEPVIKSYNGVPYAQVGIKAVPSKFIETIVSAMDACPETAESEKTTGID